MTYPFEQLTALASANQKLALSFVDTARAAGQRQAEAVSRSLSGVSDQGAQKAGLVTLPLFTGFPGFAAETEQNRQAALADSQRAVDVWRESVAGLFSPEDAQAQLSTAVAIWSQLTLAPLGWQAPEATGKAATPQASA